MRKTVLDGTPEVQWIFEQHRKTNHFYDEFLPYEFHLRMSANVANDFMELELGKHDGDAEEESRILIISAYGHDLIEDTRVSYNDVKKALGSDPADIIYALTNEKGKNRAERGNEKYYKGIRETRGAVFVKLCDRIANVQYSKMTKSGQFEMYRKETPEFLKKMGANENAYLKPMFDYLVNLFQ